MKASRRHGPQRGTSSLLLPESPTPTLATSRWGSVPGGNPHGSDTASAGLARGCARGFRLLAGFSRKPQGTPEAVSGFTQGSLQSASGSGGVAVRDGGKRGALQGRPGKPGKRRRGRRFAKGPGAAVIGNNHRCISAPPGPATVLQRADLQVVGRERAQIDDSPSTA